ncbi:hypothetical protein KIH79_06640 [Bifidobacterium sp. 82T10]|uniref:PH domain-containing protein n=1 Tax=Bifidobacterium miconis TaxID=2834435 RepID=A0ABS6WF35_9BIFI|nr:hypothetical protein [Bifidobacterium miconis]MBW3092628.1 hypothetical protein [Bifidobacterium miconis]
MATPTTPEVLFDAGNFRLYRNRIEIDRHGLFGRITRTDIIYYNDITGVQATGKTIRLYRSGLKPNITIRLRNKPDAQAALAIINGNKA